MTPYGAGCGRAPGVPGGPYDAASYAAWLGEPRCADREGCAAAALAARAAIPSPNIWEHPEAYEIENRAVDPDGLLLEAMQRIHPLAGADVLDLGCGSGFHLPVFAELVGAGGCGRGSSTGAGSVTGVEPHPPLVAAARRRVAVMAKRDPATRAAGTATGAAVRVLAGAAQAIPLPDRSVDVVHARWAYFFGPGCEPGLAEVARVLRPGGTAFVIDNDATTSTFGRWFAREHPRYDPAAVERFWRRRGFHRERIAMRWQMETHADFEAVVRIEFSPSVAAAFLAEHPGREVDYAVNLWWSRY